MLPIRPRNNALLTDGAYKREAKVLTFNLTYVLRYLDFPLSLDFVRRARHEDLDGHI
jgi:hypothetical protein